MCNKKYSILRLTILLIILFLFIYIINMVNASKTNNESYLPQAIQGVIDLTNENLNGKEIKLKGQWQFTNGKLLNPDNFNDKEGIKKSFCNLPGDYGGNGYGTFRLKVLLKEPDQIYTINIPYIQSGYKLWINDKLVGEMGKVGKSKTDMTPKLVPKVYEFHSNASEVFITLQVSNFYANEAYIDNIFIGGSAAVNSNINKGIAGDLAAFGISFCIAIYCIVAYVNGKREKELIYLGLICGIFAIKSLIFDQRFILILFPMLPYEVFEKLVYLVTYLLIPVVVSYVYEADKKVSKGIMKITRFSTTVYSIIILIIPLNYFIYVVYPYIFCNLVIILYIIFNYCKQYIVTEKWNISNKKGIIKICMDILAYIGFVYLFTNNLEVFLNKTTKMELANFEPMQVFFIVTFGFYIFTLKQTIDYNKIEKVNERLVTLDKLKDDFLAITTHDLKTPINGIIGLSQSLYDDIRCKLNLEQKKEILLINSTAVRMSNLVNDILIFSKLKTNEIALNKKPVNVFKIVELAILLVENSYNKKDIAIKNKISDKEALIYVDEDRLIQILNNILGNAIKFTHHGEIIISSKEVENFIEISVKDNGIGIPEQNVNDIFKLYSQGNGVSPKYGGNGLGLFISKKIIELHGGKIWVLSKPNKGSEFTFTLPVYTEGDKKQYNIQSIDEDEEKNSDYTEKFAYDDINEQVDYKKENSNLNYEMVKVKSNYKILIADDEEINRKLIKNYLNTNSCKFLEASNGQEVIDIIEKNDDIDLIILDMIMPDMLGYEVCKEIRKIYSLFQIPIIIMTADNRLENLVEAYKAGANEFMLKPFNEYELFYRVKTMVTLKRSVREAIRLSKQVDAANEKVEELKEYDKIRTEFFANISHELRTPLNVICSTIQLLQSLREDTTFEGEKIKYYFSIMNQNSLRLIRLINNVVDITKAEGGYLKLNLVKKDIVYVVEQISQAVAEYIKTKDISLIFDTDIEEKLMNFDEEKVEKILLNILSNAIKFTEKGGKIFVNIKDIGGYVKIGIKDTGKGIPEDKLEFIFKRFAQVDKSTTRENEGSGIGLSLTKAFVALHGGSIIAKSTLGKGSEFIITLPVELKGDPKLKENYVYKPYCNSNYKRNVAIEFSDIYI